MAYLLIGSNNTYIAQYDRPMSGAFERVKECLQGENAKSTSTKNSSHWAKTLRLGVKLTSHPVQAHCIESFL